MRPAPRIRSPESVRSLPIPAFLLTLLALLGAPASACSAPLFAAGLSFDTGGTPASVAIGDLNSDGKPDLITANDDGDVSVLMASEMGRSGRR